MTISVRPAERQDIGSIAEFNVAMAWETEHKNLSPSVIESGATGLLEQPQKGFYLVAENTNGVSGCLGITYEWSDWRNGDFWWIQSVYVVPSERRCGVFSAMYQDCQSRAKAAGAIGIRLYAEKDNQSAIATYHSLGMKTTDYRLLEVMF